MVKHIIMWKLQEMTPVEREVVIRGIKENLEALNGKIPGLLSLKVETDRIKADGPDLLLDSTFEDAQALAAYAVHPLHTAVADTFVRPFTAMRTCFDYTVRED